MMIDSELLSVLVCPLTRKPLVREGDSLVSTDPGTRRRYPIRNGIPVLLIEEGEELPANEWRAIMEKHGMDRR
ncbi:MAG: hypothetical protein MAG453_02004 [Calditrichaeota bacterium]|nr:hypothetical protein [Calditrichota bacterium]